MRPSLRLKLSRSWEEIANRFRADLENKQIGSWKAWFGQNYVWTAAKEFELLAKVRCLTRYHDELDSDGAY